MSTPAVFSSEMLYKCIAVFDEKHAVGRDAPGTSHQARVRGHPSARLRYQVIEPVSEVIFEIGNLGRLQPDVSHFVEPLGPMRLQIAFYYQLPDPKRSTAQIRLSENLD